jgi:hypothetical protein
MTDGQSTSRLSLYNLVSDRKEITASKIYFIFVWVSAAVIRVYRAVTSQRTISSVSVIPDVQLPYRSIVETDIRNRVSECSLYSGYSGYGAVSGFCEHCNESSGFIK